MLMIHHLTLTHRRDRRVLVNDFSFVLGRTDRAVLIGEEGNGKSTLLKWIYDPALTEDYIEADGVRTLQGELLGYLPQELAAEDRSRTVFEYFSRIDAFSEAGPATLHRMAADLRFDETLFYADRPMGSLSGGERIKLQLAGVLLARPDILLLDEPSNDLDIDTLEWLEEMIRAFPGAVLFISHDETLISRTADRVILLEQLRRGTVPRVTVANMPFEQFRRERSRAFAKQEQEALSERREEKKAMEKFRRIREKVEHAQASVSRQDPSTGRLLAKKMKAVKSLERRYERGHEEMTARPEEESPITIRFERQRTMPAGKTVYEGAVPQLCAPDGRVLARNLTMRVRGPEKVAVIGANGIGKSTWLREVAGQLLGREDITACYMPQDYGEVLPFDATPVEYLAPSGSREEATRVRTYLGSLKFTEEEMFHAIRGLSGGQKAKLLLLKMSLTEADVLILDEPTRNFSPLSAPEVRAILRQFPGAIISVSHDRVYLREVCDTVYRMTAEGFIARPFGT